jgi:D-psicose/D-tagatose/L-ribulose 3-epimerase
MQFGLTSGDLDAIRQSRDWGFDYVEIHAALLMPLEPDDRWPSRRRELEDTGQTLSNLCNFIPGEARYVGPNADWGRATAYLETCIGRGAEVGVKVFNWGSPASKSVPAGWPYSKAFEQIERAAHLIADICAKNDAICVIEPINPRECNVIYYVTDGALVAQSIGRPQMMTLADFFHMSLQSEPLEHLEAAKEWLAHTHTSGPTRLFPMPGQPWDQRAFLAALHAAGYDSRLSIESWRPRPGSTNADDAQESLAYLKGLWAEVTK